MSSRWLPALAVLLTLAPSTMADAAVLIEARKQRDALRLVIDVEQQRPDRDTAGAERDRS
jgi:hypothetical protein